MDAECNFYNLIQYGEQPNKPIRVYRQNYPLAYTKWVHCYELFGDLISDFNRHVINRSYFLECMRELGLFAHEISGTHERYSQESLVFLGQHMDYLYDTPKLLEMFYPPDKKPPPRPLPRILQAIDFWTSNNSHIVDDRTISYFKNLFPHKQYIRDPQSLKDLPENIYRFYEIISTYEPIKDTSILYNDDFIFSFYLLFWPILKHTGFSVKNLWSFVYYITEVLNNFTMEDYVIVDCNHFYYSDSPDIYYCGRAFSSITSPDIKGSKFVLFNTVFPMDMSPFKLIRYKQGIEFSGPPLKTEDWEPYIQHWNERYNK